MSYTNGLDDPTQFFNTKLYTGNGSTQTLTGIGFNADLIWLKNRTDSSTSHVLTDSVRTNAKYLKSNAIDSEGTYPFVTNRGSDGYDVASHSWSGASGKNYVAWNWLAGGSASSNSNGSITSSVSASTDAGFSIVSYTGTGSNATIGHGLGSVPAWIITKTRSTAQPWRVYHKALGETFGMILNDSSVKDDDNTAWNDTAPTSSVFSVGTSANTNGSGSTFIAYCFAEKKGYSKFSSYQGSGNSDGPYIHLGFSPAWVIIKNTEGTDNYNIYDNKRLGYNTNYSFLIANEPNAENTTTSTANLDLLSSGFKIRSSTGHLNTSGNKYIYMAFAESPFTNSNGIPNNAR
jgi:hypothetical protein